MLSIWRTQETLRLHKRCQSASSRHTSRREMVCLFDAILYILVRVGVFLFALKVSHTMLLDSKNSRDLSLIFSEHTQLVVVSVSTMQLVLKVELFKEVLLP